MIRKLKSETLERSRLVQPQKNYEREGGCDAVSAASVREQPLATRFDIERQPLRPCPKEPLRGHESGAQYFKRLG